jgi:hypothetical protein
MFSFTATDPTGFKFSTTNLKMLDKFIKNIAEPLPEGTTKDIKFDIRVRDEFCEFVGDMFAEYNAEQTYRHTSLLNEEITETYLTMSGFKCPKEVSFTLTFPEDVGLGYADEPITPVMNTIISAVFKMCGLPVEGHFFTVCEEPHSKSWYLVDKDGIGSCIFDSRDANNPIKMNRYHFDLFIVFGSVTGKTMFIPSESISSCGYPKK